jgi:N-acetylmuramoyl-L-alanine amidase
MNAGVKLKRKLELLMALLLLLTAVGVARKGAQIVMSQTEDQTQKVVVLDAGHGGYDPGKVGINQAMEKDVNLQIAMRLKSLLESEGISVIMTREDDNGLYSQDSANKKAEDLRNRCNVINEASAVCAVSIHQNSYPEEYVCGAQVFYHEQSAEGKKLAECIQDSLRLRLDSSNERQPKANESYYLLKNTSCPIVIVECGFLSNSKEAALLITEDYQEKTAWAVYMGIIQYFHAAQQEQEQTVLGG